MTKEKFIEAINQAEEYHLAQMEKIFSLLNGKRVANPPPVEKDSCEFGYWLYSDASCVKTFLGVQFYKNIELIHEYWHLQYEKLYTLFYGSGERAFLIKIFANRKKLSKEERASAEKIYSKLQQTTEDLLEVLNASRRRVIALKAESFLLKKC